MSVRIVGAPHQVARLEAILATQLPEASSALDEGAEPSHASTGIVTASDQLLVHVDLSSPVSTQIRFSRGERVLLRRELARAGAGDEVHFQELGLVIRSAVEALRVAANTTPAGAGADEPSAVSSGTDPLATEVRSSQTSAASVAPVNSAQQRTPLRLDFQALYAATTYAKDPGLLFGLGLGLELVLQRVTLNPGFRLSVDSTTAFEFTEARPRVAHLRGLGSVGVERWLPARFGLGLSHEKVLLDQGDARTTSESLVGTLMAELKLPLSDRVDGVLGSILDVQIGDALVSREDGPALERHRFRLGAYLGLTITAAGAR